MSTALIDSGFFSACYTAARERGYDNGRAIELAEKAQRYADAAGHEHLPAGSPEGGEFTGKVEDGQSPGDMAEAIQPRGSSAELTGHPVIDAALAAPTISDKAKAVYDASKHYANLTKAGHANGSAMAEAHLRQVLSDASPAEVKAAASAMGMAIKGGKNAVIEGIIHRAKERIEASIRSVMGGFEDTSKKDALKELAESGYKKPPLKAQRYSTEDAEGNLHRGPGEAGGQFTGKAEDGQSPQEMAEAVPEQPQEPAAAAQPQPPAALPSPDQLAAGVKDWWDAMQAKSEMAIKSLAREWAESFRKAGKKEDKNDLAQEARVALWKARMSFDPANGSWGTFVNNVVRNRFKDLLKVKSGGLEQLPEDFDPGEVAENQEPGADSPAIEAMKESIDKLPDARDRAVMAKIATGMSGDEIGNQLGMQKANVSKIAARLRPQLREMIEASVYQAVDEILLRYTDASGHEHVPSGVPEGGQFTGKAEHGQSPDDMARSLAKVPRVVPTEIVPDDGKSFVSDNVFKPFDRPRAGIDVAAEASPNYDPRVPWYAQGQTEEEKQKLLAHFAREKMRQQSPDDLAQALARLSPEQILAAQLRKEQPEGGSAIAKSNYAEDESPQRGPWKKRSPRHAVASAVNRLQSLEDHKSEYDADEIADVIGEIAEHFDAETFKQVVRKFGIAAGSTKADLVRLLVERIGKQEADHYAADASGHEHVGAGVPEGGQFTFTGGAGQSPDEMAAKLPPQQPAAPLSGAVHPVKAVVDRIMAGSPVEFGHVAAAVGTLNNLQPDQIKAIAKSAGMTLVAKSKGQMIEEVNRRMKDRLGMAVKSQGIIDSRLAQPPQGQPQAPQAQQPAVPPQVAAPQAAAVQPQAAPAADDEMDREWQQAIDERRARQADEKGKAKSAAPVAPKLPATQVAANVKSIVDSLSTETRPEHIDAAVASLIHLRPEEIQGIAASIGMTVKGSRQAMVDDIRLRLRQRFSSLLMTDFR